MELVTPLAAGSPRSRAQLGRDLVSVVDALWELDPSWSSTRRVPFTVSPGGEAGHAREFAVGALMVEWVVLVDELRALDGQLSSSWPLHTSSTFGKTLRARQERARRS